MTNEQIEAAKAAFLARGGTVKVVPTGVGVNLDAKGWQEALRHPKSDPRHPLYSPTDEAVAREAETRQQTGVEQNGYYKS
jgi:hypothetical protein